MNYSDFTIKVNKKYNYGIFHCTTKCSIHCEIGILVKCTLFNYVELTL